MTDREELGRQLAEAFDATSAANLDPFSKASGYDQRSRLHMELARLTEDPDVRRALRILSNYEMNEAARTRFTHSIPTPRPKAVASRTGLQTCLLCGRPWQVSPEGACDLCPRLMFGPTPHSQQEAEELPPGIEVDVTRRDQRAEED